MFKVLFCPEGHDLPDSACPVEVFTSQTDVEAVQFALSLHQVSNVAHTIEVVRSHDPLIVPGSPDEVCCTLFKAEK